MFLRPLHQLFFHPLGEKDLLVHPMVDPAQEFAHIVPPWSNTERYLFVMFSLGYFPERYSHHGDSKRAEDKLPLLSLGFMITIVDRHDSSLWLVPTENRT